MSAKHAKEPKERRMRQKGRSCGGMDLKADLHTHSYFSDGNSSPAETIRTAVRRGLTAVALTDHDRIDGLPEAAAATREAPAITFIPGAEISTRHDKGPWIHLLWYGVDYENPGVRKFFEELREQDDIRYRAIVDIINSGGFELDYHALKDESDYVAGIAIVRGMMALSGKPAAIKATEALEQRRFMKIYSDAYLQTAQTYPLITTAAANRVIKAFGGASVIAHPLDTTLGLKWDGLLDMLSEIDIDGLEVFCNAHLKQNDAVQDLLRLCSNPSRGDSLLITGGSDNHDPPSTSRVGEFTLDGAHLKKFLDFLEAP